jgi:hypothetical protein
MGSGQYLRERPARPSGSSERPLFPVSRDHLDSMTSPIGLWQHARGADPDPRFGFCTDDVARAIVVDTLHARELGWAAVDVSIRRSLLFLQQAFDRPTGRFLNFRDADGQWLEDGASEDCHARALGGLAAIMVEVPGSELADAARRLFVQALPAAAYFAAIRAISAALIACDSVVEAELPAEAGPVLAKLCTNLVAAFGDPPAEWPWPDPILTYENPLVPRALIVAGVRGRRRPVVARGLAVLDWLIDVQASESGNFSPIGNRGWWPRGSERSGFDQQPIEAASMVLAAATAFGVTGRARYADAAETAYGWFLGDNDVGVPVAIPVSGGCFDGLTPSGPNSNQGAESTLMWLMSLEAIREMRRSRNIEISTGEALPAVSVTRARG